MQYLLRAKNNPNYNGRTYGIKFGDGVATVTENTPVYWATGLTPQQAIKRIMVDMRDAIDIEVIEPMSEDEWKIASVAQEKRFTENVVIGPSGVISVTIRDANGDEVEVPTEDTEE